MYNQNKVDWVKKLIVIVCAIMLLLIGIMVGTMLNRKPVEVKPTKEEIVQKKEEKKVKEEQSAKLTTKDVNDFLISYYTKKNLGENKNRYQPLVTTAMYNQLDSEEKEPVNLAYKDYIVDQVLEDAEIFINVEESSAICIVNYKNTEKISKDTYEGALLNQRHNEAIKLTFQKEGKKFLVNKLNYVSLSEPINNSKNSYKQDVTTEDELETEVSKINEEVKTEESTQSSSDKNNNNKTEETTNEPSKN